MPGLQRLPPGETFQPFAVEPGHLGFHEYDVVRQGLVSDHYWIEGERVDVLSPPFRYVWPSELDLMALGEDSLSRSRTRTCSVTRRRKRAGSSRT